MRLSFNALYVCRFWQVKKESAQTEPAWKGAGQKPGIEIWRIKKFKVIESTQSHYFKHYLSSLTWGVLRTKIWVCPKSLSDWSVPLIIPYMECVQAVLEVQKNGHLDKFCVLVLVKGKWISDQSFGSFLLEYTKYSRFSRVKPAQLCCMF